MDFFKRDGFSHNISLFWLTEVKIFYSTPILRTIIAKIMKKLLRNNAQLAIIWGKSKIL